MRGKRIKNIEGKYREKRKMRLALACKKGNYGKFKSWMSAHRYFASTDPSTINQNKYLFKNISAFMLPTSLDIIESITAILTIVATIISLVEVIRPYFQRKYLTVLIPILNTISYFALGLFIVVLSANIGPYTINHLTLYNITDPYLMTASDATDFTLQALIATVIGSYIAKTK